MEKNVNIYDWYDLLKSTDEYFAHIYSRLVDMVNALNTQFDDFKIVIDYKKIENE